MTVLRRPLLSSAALVVYLTINIGACGMHQHAPASVRQDATSVGADGARLSAAAAAEDDGDHPCPICHVLHLAQSLSSNVQVTAVTGHTGRPTTPAAVTPPHPLETASHTRGPPTA